MIKTYLANIAKNLAYLDAYLAIKINHQVEFGLPRQEMLKFTNGK